MREYTLITGATSGIGLATARLLAPECNLIVHGRDEKKTSCILKELGSKHLAFSHDLSDLTHLAKGFSDFLQNNEVLVSKVIHCAGVDQTLPVKSLRAKTMDEVMSVNFYSIVELLNVLLKKSVNKSTLKNVLFISSISSIRGFKAKAGYSASKAALDGYMRVLSKELAPKVVVNSILPGAIPTPMSAAVFNSERMIKHFEEVYPLGIGSVDQLTEAIRYYHGSENSWATGQQIVIDGGFTS
jgi:NAD(P)-dependent dehydrogenase (short-subunit alcohol dehydrogenase family)